MGKHNQLVVEIIDGVLAPRYPASVIEITVTKAVITTQGTVCNAPIVDIQAIDSGGQEYFLSMTGGIFQKLAAAIDGAGARKYETSDKPTN